MSFLLHTQAKQHSYRFQKAAIDWLACMQTYAMLSGLVGSKQSKKWKVRPFSGICIQASCYSASNDYPVKRIF